MADNLSLAGKTVLGIFAHPDDESLACGGTLARLADAGCRFGLIEAGSVNLGPIVYANSASDIEATFTPSLFTPSSFASP